MYNRHGSRAMPAEYCLQENDCEHVMAEDVTRFGFSGARTTDFLRGSEQAYLDSLVKKRHVDYFLS